MWALKLAGLVSVAVAVLGASMVAASFGLWLAYLPIVACGVRASHAMLDDDDSDEEEAAA